MEKDDTLYIFSAIVMDGTPVFPMGFAEQKTPKRIGRFVSWLWEAAEAVATA